MPQPLTRFDRWIADAAIADGKIALGQNGITQGSRKRAVDAVVTLADPPRVSFAAPQPPRPENR